MNIQETQIGQPPGSGTSTASLSQLALPFSERRLLLVLGDLVVVNLAVLAALRAWHPAAQVPDVGQVLATHGLWFVALSAAWIVAAVVFDLYDLNLVKRALVVLRQVGWAVAALVIVYVLLYFLMPQALPRRFFLVFAALAAPTLGLWRWGYARLFAIPSLCRRVVIVGAGWAGRACAEMLQAHGGNLYRVVGFVDDDPAKQGTEVAGLPVLGTGADLAALTRTYQVNKVLVAITGPLQESLFRSLVHCRACGLEVVRFPTLHQALTRQVPVEHVDMSWVLDAMDRHDAPQVTERLARRLLDLAFAVPGTLVLGLLLPWVALAVALDDRGPLFYTQERAGQGGRPFDVIKFRSMRTDAEQDGKPQWAREHDDRITRVGRFLRKTRLDELPQVINVLRGDMHMVGPRPERPTFVEELEAQIPFYGTRLMVKPGLTGWAQIHYEYGNSVEDARIKLQYDLHYIRERSIWMDLYVLIKTFGVMARMGGL